MNWQKHLVKRDYGVREGIENMGFLGLLLWKKIVNFNSHLKIHLGKIISELVIKDSRIRSLDCYGYHC